MSEEPRIVTLYSQEYADLLRRAIEKAEIEAEASLYPTRRVVADDSSSSSGEDNGELDDSSSESEASATHDDDNDHREGQASSQVPDSLEKPKGNKKRPPKKNPTQRKKEALIQEMGYPPMVALPLNDDHALHVPSALLSKHDKRCSPNVWASSLLELAQSVATPKPVVVILLKSGRFAAGVFVKEKFIAHRACQRYTVRRGQGKAQSSHDNSKRNAKSMGAQLRRAGEQNLYQDISETLQDWKAHLQNAPLILVSCSKTMQKGLIEASGSLLDKERICKIPLNIGRPSFESVCAVHEIMMQAIEKEVVVVEENGEHRETAVTIATDNNDTGKLAKANGTEIKVVEEYPPLTSLHEFAAEGDVEAVQRLLETDDSTTAMIDGRAGPDFMTPVHYAAESSDPIAAADIVLLLLVQGGANPCLADGRNRVPYFLASHEKVREAFRRARAQLGEGCWEWDSGAKVGPPLTEDDLEKKLEKAAEKKRRQRARQKETKKRDKARAEEMAQGAKEEEEKRKEEEEAKRIRDGLAPKTVKVANACDFCQQVCNGKRRSQMFQRLDYVYCSSDCVQRHKRELMAQAALSRLDKSY